MCGFTGRLDSDMLGYMEGNWRWDGTGFWYENPPQGECPRGIPPVCRNCPKFRDCYPNVAPIRRTHIYWELPIEPVFGPINITCSSTDSNK